VVTATSKLKALDPAAIDGTEIARGVIANDVDAALADRDDGLLIARHALVARNALVWPSGITAELKAAAESQLKAIGILVRDAA
jgi:NAD+--asparagine ADP-ribosyltransferase